MAAEPDTVCAALEGAARCNRLSTVRRHLEAGAQMPGFLAALVHCEALACAADRGHCAVVCALLVAGCSLAGIRTERGQLEAHDLRDWLEEGLEALATACKRATSAAAADELGELIAGLAAAGVPCARALDLAVAEGNADLVAALRPCEAVLVLDASANDLQPPQDDHYHLGLAEQPARDPRELAWIMYGICADSLAQTPTPALREELCRRWRIHDML